jgi:hypothetical protein
MIDGLAVLLNIQESMREKCCGRVLVRGVWGRRSKAESAAAV